MPGAIPDPGIHQSPKEKKIPVPCLLERDTDEQLTSVKCLQFRKWSAPRNTVKQEGGKIISVWGAFKFWTRESLPEKSMLESRQRSRGSYEDTGYELSRLRDQCKGPEACVAGSICSLDPHSVLTPNC